MVWKSKKRPGKGENQMRCAERLAGMTVQCALDLLGLSGSPDTEEVRNAFRARVKEAADGYGNYSRDMDTLVQAKQYLLLWLERNQQRRRDEQRVQEMMRQTEADFQAMQVSYERRVQEMMRQAEADFQVIRARLEQTARLLDELGTFTGTLR